MRKFLLFVTMFTIIAGCPTTRPPANTNETVVTKERSDKAVEKEEERKLIIVVTDDSVNVETDDRTIYAARERRQADSDRETQTEIIEGTSNGSLILLIGAGALAAMGVLVLVWLRMTRLGLALIGAGVAVGATGAFFSWVATDGKWVLVILAIGLLGGVGYVMFRLFRNKQVDTALKHLVTGIAQGKSKTVRNNIEKSAGKSDVIIRKVVGRTKKKHGII